MTHATKPMLFPSAPVSFFALLFALLSGLVFASPLAAASLINSGDDLLASRVVSSHAPAVLNAPSVTYSDCYAVGKSSGKLIYFSTGGGSIYYKGDTGRNNIQAIALTPDGNTLYAADGGQFGKINKSNSNWTSIGSGFGTADGTAGSINLNDVKGLAFDPSTGLLYGTHRRPDDNDVLFQINIYTGQHVPNAFGSNDYLVVDRHTLPGPSDDLFNIDDIAITSSGQMYGILSRDGNDHRLFTINKSNGSISLKGSVDQGGYDRNMEGLTYDQWGFLYGTTGIGGSSITQNNLYKIDKSDGDTERIHELSSDTDFESVACPTGGTPPPPPPPPPPPDPSCPAGLNIDGQGTGAFVDGENLFPGITVSVSGAGTTGGNPRRAMIFNTANPTGGDPDLGTPNQAFGGLGVGSGGASGSGANSTAQGKAIIISEDNNQGAPNDNAAGGTLIFTFDGLVDFDSISLLDVDQSGWSVTAKDENGGTIKTVIPGNYGDNSFQLLEIDADNVRTLEVNMGHDSGAVVDLFYCAIDLECAANDAPFLDYENTTDPGETPDGGDVLAFTAPFTNNASASKSATDVEVTIAYDPAVFTYVSGSAVGGSSQNTSTPGQIVYTISTIAPGATATLTFQLQVNAAVTSGSVTASVTSAGEPDTDSMPGNYASAPNEDDACAVPFTSLPVELVAFDAQADGRATTLMWRTASETNNAGFELQHRYLDEAGKSTATFTQLAFIEGYGTTVEAKDYHFRLDDLEPGRHVFRLKQIDYDGSFDYSPEIEVAIDLPEAYLVSPVYPNPFNPQASFSFSVSRSQEVNVAIYNMLGQRVAVLFDGVVSEGTSRTLQIDGSNLQSGTYIVRVLGESFANTQTITLVK